MESRTIDLGGRSTFLTGGTGPTMVLVHGLGSAAQDPGELELGDRAPRGRVGRTPERLRVVPGDLHAQSVRRDDRERPAEAGGGGEEPVGDSAGERGKPGSLGTDAGSGMISFTPRPRRGKETE